MALGHFLHLRLFLEGIEVPVVAANVNVAANTPASASIQVIATDKILDLLPRTVVHLFYYDYIGAGNAALDQSGKVLDGPEAMDALNRQYKLLFMGELQQISFQKGHGARSVVLQCVDFSNYWDTTYQYNFGGSLFGGRRKAAFIGANANFFTSPLGHGTGTISRLLNGRSSNFPSLRGLLAGIVRMLEAIGGSYRGRNTFRGANDFASVAELRLKILQQITAADQDDSTSKLFARKAFSMWMNRVSGSLGRLVTFRGLVKMMFKFIFHEVYPCPVAKYVPEGTRQDKRRYSVGIGKAKKYNPFVNKVEQAIWDVRSAKDNLTFWRKDRASDTATRYVKAWMTAEKAVKAVYSLGSALGSSGEKAKIQGKLSAALDHVKRIRTLSTNKAGVTSANFVGPSGQPYGTLDRNYQLVLSKWKLVETALEEILKIRLGRVSVKTVATGSRVNNQIFRPDVWFTPPPRCNVLFPETYDQFSFNRNFMREVSRMELQTHNEILGNSALFNGRYYAPNVEDVRRGAKLSSRRFARLIMEHELYTGIIPMFENMSEVNLTAMRAAKVKRSGAKVSYAQRAVNHQYFKYRFESRQMQASGRFNPLVVPGFPTLIIDRHMDATDLEISALPVGEQTKALGLQTSDSVPTRSELLRQLVSPQYLGTLATFSHSVSQEGGRSQYGFMQSRVHRESTEFLGIDQAEVRRVVDGSQSVKTSLIAAAMSVPPRVGMRGPRGGRITKVKNVSYQNMPTYIGNERADVVNGQSMSGSLKSTSRGKVLPLLGTKQRVPVGSVLTVDLAKRIIAGAGKIQGKGKLSAQFDSNSDLYGTGLVVGAYEVTESSVRYERVKIDLPIEEAVAPPWLWDGWKNPKVSETYQQMFGTTAITDIAGYTTKDDSKFYVGQDDVTASQGERAEKSKPSDRKSVAVDKKHAVAVEMIDQERTVENSIDFLVRSYSFVKNNSIDVGDFLRAYGYRPVADMIDILGGSDLEIRKVEETYSYIVKQRFVKRVDLEEGYGIVDENGQLVGTEVTKKPVYGTRYIKRERKKDRYEVSGTEGFHSRAFGDVEDLFGLVSPTVKRVLGLSKKRRKVAARMDVRKRRRAVVRSYVAELTGSRGLIG